MKIRLLSQRFHEYLEVMLREEFIDRVSGLFQAVPVVALLGPRQSGKTTLARQFVASGGIASNESLNFFDLEDPAHSWCDD